MKQVFYIDTSSDKARALLEYLRTLDYVTEGKSDDYVLSDEQLMILEERHENHLSGKSKSHSWDDVKLGLGKKSDG